MKKSRMLGNYIQQLAEQKSLSETRLSEILNCDISDVRAIFKGRKILSFNEISILAKHLGTSVVQLLEGDEKRYEEMVVHCMNDFDNPENREKILDIIDEYMDILDLIY